jgi:hypothetical protein
VLVLGVDPEANQNPQCDRDNSSGNEWDLNPPRRPALVNVSQGHAIPKPCLNDDVIEPHENVC